MGMLLSILENNIKSLIPMEKSPEVVLLPESARKRMV